MSPTLKEDAYPLHHQGKSKARFCVTVSQLTMSSKAFIQGSVFPRYSKITSNHFGEGNGAPLQYSCLENPMTEEPGRLQSMRSLKVGQG